MPLTQNMDGNMTNFPCPDCGCKMFGSAFSNPLQSIGLTLKEKSFNICTNCGKDVDMAKWKSEVFVR